jgi:hypothetical protein
MNEGSSWCTIEINDRRIRASIKHVGRGKFLILDDNNEGKYSGLVIDASDVLNCN